MPLIFLGAAALGFGFFYLRTAGKAPVSPPAGPPSDALIAEAPLKLVPKAAVIADRYNCLCGECSDTLGACTCTRDKGSNEMKSTLNRLSGEKKTIEEIDAAMAAKYGAHVLTRSGAKPASR